MKAVSHPHTATIGPLSSRVIKERWPVWRESVRGEAPKVKLERHSVTAWLRYLKESYPALEALPGRGRALKAIIDGLMRHYDYKEGGLFPALETIALSSGYSRTYVHAMLKVAQDLGIIDWTRRCDLVKRAKGYMLKQVSNAYLLRPPSQWAKSMADAGLKLFHKAMGRHAIPSRKAKKTAEEKALAWIEGQKEGDMDLKKYPLISPATAVGQMMTPPPKPKSAYTAPPDWKAQQASAAQARAKRHAERQEAAAARFKAETDRMLSEIRDRKKE